LDDTSWLNSIGDNSIETESIHQGTLELDSIDLGGNKYGHEGARLTKWKRLRLTWTTPLGLDSSKENSRESDSKHKGSPELDSIGNRLLLDSNGINDISLLDSDASPLYLASILDGSLLQLDDIRNCSIKLIGIDDAQMASTLATVINRMASTIPKDVVNFLQNHLDQFSSNFQLFYFDY
jgi:hypothetical protein